MQILRTSLHTSIPSRK